MQHYRYPNPSTAPNSTLFEQQFVVPGSGNVHSFSIAAFLVVTIAGNVCVVLCCVVCDQCRAILIAISLDLDAWCL
jgi:hypothetical protein